MWMLASKFQIEILVLIWLSVCQENHGWRALAQGSDAGKVYLDQRELELKFIVGNATANDGICGSLEWCSCSRARCHPLSGGAPLQCVAIGNQFFDNCNSGSCKQNMLVDSQSYVNPPAPGSINLLSTEVARDICLQRLLDSTFRALSIPEEYVDFFFGSASGAFRQFPWREQNETQCTSCDPRWRPWYVNGISVSKDVKILVDVAKSMEQPVTIDYNRPPASTYLNVAKDITLALLKSFSPQDYVEVISFDNAGASS